MMGTSCTNSNGVQRLLNPDWYLRRVNNWKLKWCIFPRKCFLSNKQLWGKRSYQGISYITGPGEPIEESYWLDKYEFLIWQLKGKQ